MLLVSNNYKFYKDQITQEGVKRRCTLKSCTSMVYISEDKKVILILSINIHHIKI